MSSLSTTIKSIQDVMRKDVGVDGDAQRIGQLVWLLFLKIWDDRESELELLDDDFRSPLVDLSWTDAAGAGSPLARLGGGPGGGHGRRLAQLRERHAVPGAQGAGARPHHR